MRISSADFLENFETLLDKAFSEPITITRDGRDRLVVLSVDEYERLKRRGRSARRSRAPQSTLVSARSLIVTIL